MKPRAVLSINGEEILTDLQSKEKTVNRDPDEEDSEEESVEYYDCCD